MLPTFAIIGRPNVGKSTLFNWLTQTRDALVADMPGVTRDRQYGRGVIGDRPYLVVDTGGIAEGDDLDLAGLTQQQADQAIKAADIVLFLVDAKVGLTPADQQIARQLRVCAEKVVVLVNKTDHIDPQIAVSEFYAMGFEKVRAIAAHRGQNVKPVMQELLASLSTVDAVTPESSGIKIAIIGRPNVGKSTLINRILGEERVMVFDAAGTTRDSIYVPCHRRGQDYVLIDTAGVRRRAKVNAAIEKLSFIKAMQAMEDAQVVLLVINAAEGISEQDLRLLGMVIDAGKALVLVFNQWDKVDTAGREQLRQDIERRLPFAGFARRYFISALHGSGVGLLYKAINEAYECASREISTAQLTKTLEKAVADHQPPMVRGRRVKLRFAHLGGHHPMVIMIHGKQTDALPSSYKKYLAGYLRKALDLVGIPLVVRFKNDVNPYQPTKD